MIISGLRGDEKRGTYVEDPTMMRHGVGMRRFGLAVDFIGFYSFLSRIFLSINKERLALNV